MKKDKSVSWYLQPELMDTTEIAVDEILVTEIETLACLEDSLNLLEVVQFRYLVKQWLSGF